MKTYELGQWNGWTAVVTDGSLWLVNPITGHRRSATLAEAVAILNAVPVATLVEG